MFCSATYLCCLATNVPYQNTSKKIAKKTSYFIKKNLILFACFKIILYLCNVIKERLQRGFRKP